MSVVTLAQAKEYLRITTTDSTLEAMVQLILDGAEDVVARHCAIALASSAVSEIAPGGMQFFSPSTRPITAVTSIYHADEAYSYGSDEWVVRDGRIYPADDGVQISGRWPYGTYYISYTAGYTTVPAGLKQAILLITARMFDNRGGLGSLAAGGGSQGWAGAITPGSDLDLLLAPYASPNVVGR